VPQTCLLLGAALRRKELTPTEAIALVEYMQHNNYKAKVSDYRRDRSNTRPRDGPQ